MTIPGQLTSALAGRYEIEREIGRGGMATVFLARDVKHQRRVALKVLDPELGAVLGADRFLSEIRVTANLSHPNLLPLFDSGEANGLLFYVMPFVDGESLRARLNREKQLAVPEAVRIATAIASALDYAHRNGIIHRDLKPENILLQEDQPLIADFGIALAVTKAGGARVTQTGLSLGTPQYMSPEQATGDRGIDARTDIYSLGAVTYEMLSGEPPHPGNTAQAIIARLMTEEPRPLTATRRTVPEHVDAAVRCALEKLPADRFQTAKEFAEALNGRGAPPTSVGHSATRRAPQRRARVMQLASVVAASVALSAIATWLFAQRTRPVALPVHFELVAPPGQTIVDPSGVSLGVSRDGRSIAYVARTGGRTGVHVRDVGNTQPRAVAGTEGAWEPRISPDGQWLLFGVLAAPKKVLIQGGTPIALKATGWTGATWALQETIVLAGGGKLQAFSPDGGVVRVLFNVDTALGQITPADPIVLSGGKVVAFRLFSRTGSRLATVPIDSGTPTLFDLNIANPIGYDDGWLFFGRDDGTIAAVELSGDGRKIGTRVVQVLDGAKYKGEGGVVAALSPSGTLVYMEGDSRGRLAFVDRGGRVEIVPDHQRTFAFPQFSPDGKRVALSVRGTAGTFEIWILDIATNTMSRLTAGSRAAWTPDGMRIVFLKGDPRRAYTIPADASGPEELLSTESLAEVQVAPDGQSLIARGERPGLNRELYRLSLRGTRTLSPLFSTPASEFMGRVSPDGRWLAYVSDESGEDEVYVRPLDGGARTQISRAGGTEPVWAPDAKQVYYLDNGIMYAAQVRPGSSALEVVRRDSLFEANFSGNPDVHQTYDISPDGKRFIAIAADTDLKIQVVVNWLSEVRAKLK